MKNTIALFIFVLSISIFTSCSNKSTAPNNKEELKQPGIGDDIPRDVATSVVDKAPITKEGVPQMGDEEDCHGKRQVTQDIEEANGAILKVADKFVISSDGESGRYNPCELPGKYKKEGLKVRFSGAVLEIFPNERLIATPFRLKNIIERDD